MEFSQWIRLAISRLDCGIFMRIWIQEFFSRTFVVRLYAYNHIRCVAPPVFGEGLNSVSAVYYFLLRPDRGAEYCDHFVCLCVCLYLCLPVREHISGTAGPIIRKFFMQIPCDRGSILLWRRCDMLCTSGFMDDLTFGRNGPYGDAWKAEPFTYYH